jgi:hypothetical protein
MDLVELASGMGPARDFVDRSYPSSEAQG